MKSSKSAYAPHISDPDPPVRQMSDAEIDQAAKRTAERMKARRSPATGMINRANDPQK